MRVKDDQGRGDKIFRNSVPLVTCPFKFFPLLLFSNISFHFSHFNNILELVQEATYVPNMSPWEHLSWQRYNEDIGPPRQGTNIWFIMVSWISIHQIIKHVSRCIHTPCSRRRATTFQKEEKRITSTEEEVTVMTRTTTVPATSLSSQTTLFPPSLQGRRQRKRQLTKNLAGWPTVEREALVEGDPQADKKRQRWNTILQLIQTAKEIKRKSIVLLVHFFILKVERDREDAISYASRARDDRGRQSSRRSSSRKPKK